MPSPLPPSSWRRVAVVGCSGGGKSRLSADLGRRLGLPVVHLDAHYWRPGWTPTPDGEWERVHAGLVAADAWVMDGSYHNTLRTRTARADAVVCLDLPRWRCLLGVFERWARLRGTVRPDTAPGCPERWDFPFLGYVWGYRRRVRPKVLDALRAFEEAGGSVRVLRNRREAEAFLASLPRAPDGDDAVR